MAKRRGPPNAKTRQRTGLPDGLAGVRRSLHGYANRGVFRAFTERPPRAGRYDFRFVWLAREPFRLTYEPKSGTLTFTNALPNVPARSTLYTELKTFIVGRTNVGLPDHRRIDPRRATPSYSRQRGTMAVHVVARRGHHAYGVNRAVNLVHDIYLHLQSRFPEYLWENYDLSED